MVHKGVRGWLCGGVSDGHVTCGEIVPVGATDEDLVRKGWYQAKASKNWWCEACKSWYVNNLPKLMLPGTSNILMR